MEPGKKSALTRGVFFLLGMIFLVLAYIGIITPGIPGIPFILLAAFFFLQSSQKMYEWMLRRRVMGKVMRKVFSEEKTPLSYKLFVISQFWVSLIVAQVFFIRETWQFIVINGCGIICSAIIFRLMK